MVVWAHDFRKVVVLLKDLGKQQIVRFVYGCCWIIDELTLEIIERGFWVGDLLDWSPTTICFTNLHELIKLEKEESARKSLRNFNRILTTVESSSGKRPMKKLCKEKTKAQNKEKILDIIVLEKDEKEFDAK